MRCAPPYRFVAPRAGGLLLKNAFLNTGPVSCIEKRHFLYMTRLPGRIGFLASCPCIEKASLINTLYHERS